MRYGQGLLDEILRRTDIVQLVGRRVKLVRKGRAFWGCCPFHKEKSPSFKVENERRTYKCFGCGVGGDAFKWLIETEGLSFPEAVERLAEEAGVELPKWNPDDEAREAKRKSLYEIVETACVFFEGCLWERQGTEALAYLRSRGLGDSAIRRFRLGHAPDSPAALMQHLQKKGIPLEDMTAAGLVRPAEQGRQARDFFFNRVTFPIGDGRGRIVAFGARALVPDAKPKYLNTGDTPLFSKGRLLYNFSSARPAALKAGTIIVAEGYMDVIALVGAGFENVVAPLGTALTEQQLTLLWGAAAEPVLAFDGDTAGLKAAHRAAHLALPFLVPGQSLRFAFLPDGEDPDSLIRSHGAAAMRAVLEGAEPLSRVLWRAETDGRDFSTPERRAGLERSLSEIVGRIGDSKVADYYRRDFDQQIFEAFKRRRPGPEASNRKPMQASRGRPVARGSEAEPVSGAVRRSLLARTGRKGARKLKEVEVAALLLRAPDLAAFHGELLAVVPFSEPLLDRLRHELLNLAASGFRLENQRLENHLVDSGMGELVARLKAVRVSGQEDGERTAGDGSIADAKEIEARWLAAAQQLQEMAELEPERNRAVERFNAQATEESWSAARRLLALRAATKE